jgi:alkanesulfonate monooxygenase SsuD/methylene tetrahydromethanopterin reductase-like flavin-dependent oxidoreductase (luciferase family)
LIEYLEIIKKMWTEKNPTYKGNYYSIKNAINEPKPVQKPHPPLSLGTRTGGNKMLKVIAKFADIWNFSSMPTPNEYINALHRLKKICSKVGRDSAEIENSIDIFLYPETNKKYLQQNLQNLDPLYQERGIIGSPNYCIEKIEEYISIGVTYFILYFPGGVGMRMLNQIGEEILPIFKDR